MVRSRWTFAGFQNSTYWEKKAARELECDTKADKDPMMSCQEPPKQGEEE